VIDNPGASKPDFRETSAYLEICRELRRNMEAVSATRPARMEHEFEAEHTQ
jgi:hypothetical protein